MRQQVLELEVTFISGETVRFKRGERVDFPFQPVSAPKTTKNSAGYYLVPGVDWIELLAGSEGTLAVVSEIELRLHPIPPAILSGVIFFEDSDSAITAIESWRTIPELRLLEFMDEFALDFLRPQYAAIPPASRAALLIEQNLTSEEDAELDRWSDRLAGSAADAAGSWFGFSNADQERFREFRHLLPVIVVERARRSGFPKYGTDFAVPLERGLTTHRHFRSECMRLVRGKFTIFGHAGDANNHINLLPEMPADAEVCDRLIRDFAKYVAGAGGTIAAEHGVGKNKRHLLPLMYSAADLQSMRDVKTQLDPQWLLGRGNILTP